MGKTKSMKVKENGNLSLADAKVQAASMSATKKAYVILEGDGCFVAYTPLPGHIHTFYKGVEIPKTERVKPIVTKEEVSAIVSAEPKETTKTKTSKTKNEMATKTKTPAKKTAPKKTAAKKAVKENRKPIAGKAIMMKRKDIVKGLNAGKRICRASTGRKMNPVYQGSLPNQEYEIQVIVVA